MVARSLSVAALWLTLLATGCGPTVPALNDGDGGPDNCPEGRASCQGNPNACETDTTVEPNCGGCGIVCGVANTLSSGCFSGQCQLTCADGYGNCDGDPTNGCETNLNTVENCGACNHYCGGPNALGTCAAGTCELSCHPGYGDCNESTDDGCESALTTERACGACDNGCTTNDCSGGMCTACDSVTLDSSDPVDAAKAMGICGGLVSAQWVLPNGGNPPATADFALGHGNVAGFGPNVSPRHGMRMLALSSGTARQPSDPGYESVGGFDKFYTHGHPFGFPKESPACPGVTTGTPHDGVALKVELQVPDWAQGLAFDFKFYTYEWPTYICSEFNDFFVALLEPFAPGLPDGNISFDSMGNPVSVNNAFLTACGCLGGPPCSAGGKTFSCEDGTTSLTQTGFESHAATSWLTTTAPVQPNSTIKLTLGVYDSGDGILDSTTLIDNFRWLPEPPPVETNPIE